MPSLLPEFEYDIFISYRHNDNLSNWVSDFVRSLKEELAASIKEPVCVYFDRNSNDGLLETHSVDKSLEGKLKCLIFIPILSQTYCDVKSFAWQHELVVFNRLAREDRLGRDINLRSGNVMSRILPVKIHDLDAEDKLILENELGGALRAIEFIYREPGVNRPLLANEENPLKNQHHTIYRNQVNKVANSIKEIITTLRSSVNGTPSRTTQDISPPTRAKISLSPYVVLAVVGLTIFFSSLYGIYRFKKPADKAPEVSDKSIAVLPFVDMSQANDQSWFSDGLTEEILNSLAHIKDMKVIARTSSFSFRDRNLPIKRIADSLGVKYVVEGSVRKVKEKLRITVQLIRAKDGFHIWSSTYDRKAEDILMLQENIATQIAESLGVHLDPHAIEKMTWTGTDNSEAFLSFLKGLKFFDEYHDGNRKMTSLQNANLHFARAIAVDPDFVQPYFYHADLFLHYLTTTNNQTYRPDTLTYSEAYRLMNKDLDYCIAKSKNDDDKDFFTFAKIMYSDDWTGLKPLTEKILSSPQAVRLLSFQPLPLFGLMIDLGYGKEVINVSREILKKDPLNSQAQHAIIYAYIFSGNMAQANRYLDENIGKRNPPFTNSLKILMLMLQHEYGPAYKLSTTMDSSFVAKNPGTIAILQAKNAKLTDAERSLKKALATESWDILWALNEIKGKAEANKEAARLDKKLVPDFRLLNSFIRFHNHLPWDISATPNFERRLQQGGIVVK